jgi:hypothetical protein
MKNLYQPQNKIVFSRRKIYLTKSTLNDHIKRPNSQINAQSEGGKY